MSVYLQRCKKAMRKLLQKICTMVEKNWSFCYTTCIKAHGNAQNKTGVRC
jgi:hypothetical protein